MGLSNNSTGTSLLNSDFNSLKNKCDYTIAIAGNPNVGKSTIFNNLTGMHQHTGNWPGKTVSNACGITKYKNKKFLLVDIPGTYSLMSNSEEEEIARNYICFGNPDVTILVLDATCLERSLNLVYQTMEITKNIVVCINLLDEAQKKGISIDLEKLEELLGVPVVGTIARKKKTLQNLMQKVNGVCLKKNTYSPNLVRYDIFIEENVSILSLKLKHFLPIKYKNLSRWICIKLIENDKHIISDINKNIFGFDIREKKSIKKTLITCKQKLKNSSIYEDEYKSLIVTSIINNCSLICKKVCTYKKANYQNQDRKIDKILTSKMWGIPIMLGFLGFIFWLTIIGANYPSKLLSIFFELIEKKITYLLNIYSTPPWLLSLLINGIYKTLSRCY